jgi:hypothetical protein
VKTILVQELGGKGPHKKAEVTPDKQNPHIILVEPELTAGGEAEHQESTGMYVRVAVERERSLLRVEI